MDLPQDCLGNAGDSAPARALALGDLLNALEALPRQANLQKRKSEFSGELCRSKAHMEALTASVLELQDGLQVQGAMVHRLSSFVDRKP